MQIVIIGGDAAGMSAASQAKRISKESTIIVLEQSQDVSYGACGLPYKLPDDQDMDDLQIISAESFRKERGLDVRLGHKVEKIDPKAHKVFGNAAEGNFELDYDRLVIATGARVIRPPIPGLEQLWGKGAYPLKTLSDGRDIKQALAKKPKKAIVIGAGYIGLEATEGLSLQGMDVSIIEAMPQLLPFLPETFRDRVMAEAKANNVSLHLGQRVEKIEQNDAGMITVHTEAATHEADLLLVATGVKPNSELAADAGLELGAAKSIAVDPFLYTSDEAILSAGDCADALHGITNKSCWVPLALRANRAGKLAGANLFDKKKAAPAVMGTAAFKFFGLEIATTGLSLEAAQEQGFDAVAAQIKASTRAHYYPGGGKLSVGLVADRKNGKLLGGSMVGPEGAAHKIDTVVAALYAGLTAENLYEMDLAYAPPFGPSWSPLLICASKLMKQL